MQSQRPKSHASRIILVLVLIVLLVPAGALADPLGDVPDSGDKASGAVGDATDGASDTVDDVTDTADDAASDVTHDVSDIVSDDETDEATGGATDDITDAVDDTIDDTEDAIDDSVDDATDTVDDTVDEVEDTVDDTADDATDTVDDVVDDVDDPVDDVEDTVGDVTGGSGADPGGSGGTGTGGTEPTRSDGSAPASGSGRSFGSRTRSVVGEGSGATTDPVVETAIPLFARPGTPGLETLFPTADNPTGRRGGVRPYKKHASRNSRATGDVPVTTGPRRLSSWVSSLDEPEIMPNSAEDFVNDLTRQATEIARRLAFPLALATLVLVFLTIQGRVDRKDPKLSLAPIDGEQEVLYFE